MAFVAVTGQQNMNSWTNTILRGGVEYKLATLVTSFILTSFETIYAIEHVSINANLYLALCACALGLSILHCFEC
jgi:hypothetical protein